MKSRIEEPKHNTTDFTDNSSSGETANVTEPPSQLLAWCSTMNNRIRIIDFERKQDYAKFSGVVFNRKEESGCGDVTFNVRRNLLGTLSLQGKIAYHLFKIEKGSRSNYTVKLLRKSKWHLQNHKTDNWISSLDFHPNGEFVATIDRFGLCSVSNITTNHCSFHINMKEDSTSRCRWSTNSGDSLVYIKYRDRCLNILDVEKQALTLENPIKLEELGEPSMFFKVDTNWLDVCPNNGNLLAAAGYDKNIKIYDHREAKIVKVFEMMHTEEISCVRWNSSGDLLGSSSYDATAKITDFKTGKIILTGNTTDNRKL